MARTPASNREVRRGAAAQPWMALRFVIIVLAILAACSCGDLKVPGGAIPNAPRSARTAIVAYFEDATRSTAGLASLADSDLQTAVIPVAIRLHAEFEVFAINGDTYATGIPMARADYAGLSDNPDERNRQVKAATSALVTDVRRHRVDPSTTTDIVGILREASALRSSMAPNGHLLVAVGGDAVPTTQSCNACFAMTDVRSAGALASSCLGNAPIRADGIEFWFMSAGQSADGQFTEAETIATRNLLLALVHDTGGLLCPFDPGPIVPGSCR
jgi:hypothetical protein